MYKRIIILIAAAITAAVCITSCSSRVSLQIKTQQGIVEGFDQEGVKTFLGVPFAAAPVGELRWRAPQAAPKWDGVRDAKCFGNDPMQPRIYSDMVFRGPSFSEDCLYLNIWTSATSTADKLPVLIYFNGGGLMAGSGSEPRYDGTAIARKGVIGVTANYREGIFGFFAHPELSAEEGGSGDYGYMDQVAAIKWVKDNIKAFGGDPNRITIAGESAGSYSVSLLMASPLSKDLFAGVILSSGAELSPNEAVELWAAEEAGKARLESKGVNSIAQARDIDANTLQEMFPPTGQTRLVLDNVFMSEAADSVFKRGEQSRVPMLAGWNSLEGSPLSALMGIAPTLDNYKKIMSAEFGDKTEEIFSAYGLLTDEDLLSQKGQNLAGDMFTGFCTWKCCDYHSKTSGQKVFRYKFNRPRPNLFSTKGKAPYGALHSTDIEYALGNLDTNPNYEWTEDDYEVSEKFLGYYVNFCKTGNPNGPGLPEWTELDPVGGTSNVMQIDVDCYLLDDPDVERGCQALDSFYSKQ